MEIIKLSWFFVMIPVMMFVIIVIVVCVTGFIAIWFIDIFDGIKDLEKKDGKE
jgi:hypothetical protein